MIRVFQFQVTIIIGHNDACTHVCNATMGVTKQNHFLLLSTLLHSRPTRSSGSDDLSDIDIWMSLSIIYVSKSKWQRNIVQRCATTVSFFHGRSMPGRTGVLAGMQEIFEGPSTSSRKTCQGLLSTWCPWQVIRLGFSSLVLGAGILRIIKVNMFFPPWYFFKTFKAQLYQVQWEFKPFTILRCLPGSRSAWQAQAVPFAPLVYGKYKKVISYVIPKFQVSTQLKHFNNNKNFFPKDHHHRSLHRYFCPCLFDRQFTDIMMNGT